jgi:hypothetical protein
MTHTPPASFSSLSAQPLSPAERGPERFPHEALRPAFPAHELAEGEGEYTGPDGVSGLGPPGRDVPPTRAVPLFPALPLRRAGLARWWLRRHAFRGPALALLALCGGLLLAAPWTGPGAPTAEAASRHRSTEGAATKAPPSLDRRVVRTAVRIAEPAGLRLVRPGDRVDVLAVSGTGTRAAARVVVAGARIATLPHPPGATPVPSRYPAMPHSASSPASSASSASEAEAADVWPDAETETRWDEEDSAAVVVLAVPRAAAVDLAAASASSALAVVAC